MDEPTQCTQWADEVFLGSKNGENPDNSLSKAQVAGTYHYIDLTTDGQTGVGYYELPATGTAVENYFKYDGDAGEGTGTSVDYQPLSRVNNMFVLTDDHEGDIFKTYLVLVAGEIMMHFCYDMQTGERVSYGVGAKIN